MSLTGVAYGRFYHMGGPLKRVSAPLKGFGVDVGPVGISFGRFRVGIWLFL